MDIIKSILKVILFLVLGAVVGFGVLVGVVACDELTSEKTQSTLSVAIGDVGYGFIDAETILDDKDITVENSTVPTEFDVIKKYYLVIEYTMTANEDNSGEFLVTNTISFDNVAFIDGNLYTNTSGTEPVKEPIKGDQGQQKLDLKITNRVPNNKDGTLDVRIVVKLGTLKAGESGLSMSFGAENFNIFGETSGFSKIVNIVRVNIEKPTISFDDSTLQIKFNHVKHADYYKIFVDGVLKEDQVFDVNEFVSVGDQLYWDISSLVSGPHRIKIQAFSDSANFITSNYSNEINVYL